MSARSRSDPWFRDCFDRYEAEMNAYDMSSEGQQFASDHAWAFGKNGGKFMCMPPDDSYVITWKPE